MTEFPLNERQWDDLVFSSVNHFQVVIGRTPSTRHKKTFTNLVEALNYAFKLEKQSPVERPIVYAICIDGRQTMLIKSRWADYLNKWWSENR